MSGLLVTGGNSAIVREFMAIHTCPTTFLTRERCDMSDLQAVEACRDLIGRHDRFVFAHGVLHERDALASMQVNLLSTATLCEMALENPRARIVVIGSESATKGSHDHPYWFAKAALHSYVRERRLKYHMQQLVCIAPSAIANTGMSRQKEPEELHAAAEANPNRRLLEPLEVARLIHYMLFVDRGYITNTVVEMNGGKFAHA